MSEEYRLQDPGEGISEAEIVNLYIEPGQEIKEDDNLLDVETDKAVVEVPSPFSGTIDEVRVKQGEVASVGDVLFTYTSAESASDKEVEETGAKPEKSEEKEPASSKKKAEKEKEKETRPEHKETPQKEQGKRQREEKNPPPSRGGTPVPAAPSTRRLARELEVDINEVPPSGPHERVTDEDVHTFAGKKGGEQERGAKAEEEKQPPPSERETSRWGEVEQVPLRGLRRKVAEHMVEAWEKIPHVTHQMRVDITELESLRQRHKQKIKEAGGHLTVTIFAIKAVIAALKQFPRFNASLDEAEENLILKHYYHIGVAVDTEKGLLVPVLHNADQKNLMELALELDELIKRAKEGKLELEEMRGGSFTITNPGMLGGHAFTPLINHPEAAILGLAQAALQPVVQGTIEDYDISPRLMLPLCLAFDHRLNDGADAARFVSAIASALEDPEQLLLKS